MVKYVIALDAGTTSVRAFVYDLNEKKFVYGAQQEVGQSFPRPGWVEQDAEEIYFKAAYVLNDCMRFAGEKTVAGVGFTNQRETTVLWDRQTGDPVCPAIGWQCRRTAEWCSALDAKTKALVRERTGLVPDAYFSASKIRWDLDHIPAARALLSRGRLCAGTVDSWLIYKFTDGRSFVTDVTNASRTMLFNIHTLDWDETLLERFSIPREILPKVRACDARMGEMPLRDTVLPLAGTAGDQQSALIGQDHFRNGAIPALQYGRNLRLFEERASDDGRLYNGRQDRLCAGRERISCGQRHPVAARRSRADLFCRRERADRTERGGCGRRQFCARVHGAGRAPLGSRRPRPLCRDHARDDARASRACRA